MLANTVQVLYHYMMVAYICSGVDPGSSIAHGSMKLTQAKEKRQL